MYLFNPITELVFNLHVWVTGFKKDTGPNPQLGSGVWKSTEMAQKLGEIRCVCTMGRRSQGAVMGLPHFAHGCVVTQAYGTGRSCFYHGGGVSHQDLRYAHQQTFKIEVDFLFKEKKLVSSHPVPAQGNVTQDQGMSKRQVLQGLERFYV